MAKKSGKNKLATDAEKELKATVKKLRAGRDKAEAKAESWKQKAKKHRAASALSSAEVTKLEKRLKKADRPAVVVTPVATSTTPTTIRPDASWTVAELKAEARTRGLAGYSRKSKAQLLSALR